MRSSKRADDEQETALMLFERQEIAVVLFFTGLGLLLIGVLNVGAWAISNMVDAALGVFLMAVGILWWHLLRRR